MFVNDSALAFSNSAVTGRNPERKSSSPRDQAAAADTRPPSRDATPTTPMVPGIDHRHQGEIINSVEKGGFTKGEFSYPGSEEVLPNTTNMDISTGHMVLAYMEDHLKNKQRLEQEWVGLCGYEAEPCATTVAFKAENKKKNRYPDKLPYDHNRVILNVMANANNSDYINASTVVS